MMKETIKDGLKAMGLSPTPEMIDALTAYGGLLRKANEVMNLTAVTEPREIARLHFLDSAALLTMADFAGRDVVDVGSGAGFPGVPLRVLQPDIRLTVLESVGKKVDFIAGACESLSLDVRCVWGRAEEQTELRERFDIAVSRAVAELDVLAELCLPLVRPGGLFLAMKGPDCGGEAERASFAIRALGGRIREIRRYTIPGTEITHAVVVAEKTSPTPPQYPRRYAQIKKRPLHG